MRGWAVSSDDVPHSIAPVIVGRRLALLDARFPSSGALYRELALRNVPLGIERGTLSSRRAAEIENLLLRTRWEEQGSSASKSR